MKEIKRIAEVLPGSFSNREVARVILQVNLMVWG